MLKLIQERLRIQEEKHYKSHYIFIQGKALLKLKQELAEESIPFESAYLLKTIFGRYIWEFTEDNLNCFGEDDCVIRDSEVKGSEEE